MSSSTLFFGTTQTKTVTQNGTYYEYVKDITGNGKRYAVKIVILEVVEALMDL